MSENMKSSPNFRERLTEFSEKYKIGAFFQKYTMTIALVVVTLIFALWNGKEGLILTPMNIWSLISTNSYVILLATGMLLCILTGGNIDLSVGSLICLSGAIGCVLISGGTNPWLAVLVMILVGLAAGLFQGFWIAKFRVPAFIATLAGMYAFRGIASIILNGLRVDVKNEVFLQFFGDGKTSVIPDFIRDAFGGMNSFFSKDNKFLVDLIGSNGNVTKFNLTCFVIGAAAALIFIAVKIVNIIRQKKLKIKVSLVEQIITMVVVSALIVWVCFKLACFGRGFPMVLIWIGLVVGIYAYVTNNTAMGRYLYAVGGNEKATALSGVKTRNVYWFAYANMGLLAGLAGVLTAARGKGMDPIVGEGYEMDAIAACFIGGASAYGGTGKVSGMIIGALLMGV
ncbi:MAG: hypothetical protein CW338_12530, partial [Clostridiales bacterium]|nr:hypothetical protein [Clostridiales bacterium]